MTKEQRPTSKVIQIGGDRLLEALCEDGSIWYRQHVTGDQFKWECILEAHKEPVEEEPTKKGFCVDIRGLDKMIKDNGNIYIDRGLWGQTTTDKLPEVGKRYESKDCDWIVTVNKVDKKRVGVKETGIYFQAGSFLDSFEELPDQEPTTKEARDFLSDFHNNKFSVRYGYKMSKEVQEALKELKKDLADFGEGLLDDDVDCEGFDIYSSAMELVNALEAKQDKPEGEE